MTLASHADDMHAPASNSTPGTKSDAQVNARADLVAFAEDWGRHPTSSQHLLRHLAANRRVLYVNSLGLRRPRLDAKDARRVVTKVLDVMGRGGRIDKTVNAGARSDNLDVVSPLAISWPSSRLAFQFNRFSLHRQINREMASRGVARPVLWISIPSALPVVGALGERAVVYYCCDDFGSLVGVDHEPVMAMERQIVERADLIFATSDVLAERMPASKTVLVPHGTDLELFATPLPRASDLPSGSKIAGFYGSLDARLDFDMLTSTASRMPDWQFVLIGPVSTDLSALEGHRNIHVLGPRPYSQLPAYVQHWQASMILYRRDEQVRAGNPLKLREYLAAGTPIATIDVPSLSAYANLLAIAATPDGFADAIGQAAQDTARNDQRRAAVAGDSWQARADMISSRDAP